MFAQWIGDVVKYVHICEQRPGLKQHAHPFAHSVQARTRHRRNILAIKKDLTVIWCDLPANQTE